MVSAIVLSYNRRNEVLTTIEKLKTFAQALPFAFEIIVVDNASTDDTSAHIELLHPDIVLVTKQQNNGIEGWNAGFAVASYNYLLVLDDDSNPEWGIPEAVAYMEGNPDMGILALNVTSGPYRTDTWTWQNGLPWQDKEEIVGFFGCGAIIRKEVYNKIGGFGDWLLVYGHEWDYGIRCVDAGYKIQYFKNSSVAHRASVINRSLRRSRIFGTRNELAIVYKYFGHKRWNFIATMFVNDLKRIKKGEVRGVYYDIIGFIKFLKFRHTLTHTPVTAKTQEFFVNHYTNTYPVFRFLTKLFSKRSNNI